MKGHGEKLSRKQEQAIIALLSHATMMAAAAACGVSETTLWRWLQMPEFRERCHEARRRAVEQAIGELQQLASEATKALKRNLTCGVPSAEIRAALGILDHATQGIELIEMEERLRRLEERLIERDGLRKRA